MHILAVAERAPQVFVAREVRHDPQLDLRIVGGDDARTRRSNEAFADVPARRRANRDVLQVGLVRGQPAGDRRGLRIRRMHAARRRVDAPRQLVGVGRLELRQRAVLENQARQRVVERQLGERILVGRGLARGRLLLYRQLLPLEENLLDLLGRAEVERLAGGREGLLLDLQDLLAQLVALRLELGPVEQYAIALDAK